MARLALLPALRRYTSLSFSDTRLYDGGAAHLARSPHLGQLLNLGLAGTHLDDEDLSALFGSRAFPRLTSLDLSNDREGQSYSLDGLRALAGAVFAGTLERLAMERRWFGGGAISVLAALPRLESLMLDGGALGDEGAEALAALPRRWTRLGLQWNEIGERGARTLANAATLSQVEELRLGNNPLGDEGARAVLASPHLGRLRVLELSGGLGEPRLSAAVWRTLVDAPVTGTLEALDLSRTALGAEGARALAAAPLARLRRLDLSGSDLGDEGALALAHSPFLDALEWLNLGPLDVSPKTREALTARFGARVKFGSR